VPPDGAEHRGAASGGDLPSPRAPDPLLVAAAALVFVADPTAPEIRRLADAFLMNPKEISDAGYVSRSTAVQ